MLTAAESWVERVVVLLTISAFFIYLNRVIIINHLLHPLSLPPALTACRAADHGACCPPDQRDGDRLHSPFVAHRLPRDHSALVAATSFKHPGAAVVKCLLERCKGVRGGRVAVGAWGRWRSASCCFVRQTSWAVGFFLCQNACFPTQIASNSDSRIYLTISFYSLRSFYSRLVLLLAIFVLLSCCGLRMALSG